ncbi:MULTISPECIES: hypothetical protein [Pseudoalteromonas]|uniref:Outer membrane protein beta-barrel domain-containing protein n=2 Tax=Pseudoalteromonas TaxID=53246 RepID=V4H585_PSEL2|nr:MULTISPECIES: hypothetical protein [Pseudoalteromonas]ESP92661.1 hypothetical protein PL2TA16_03859 [Pseudoalteromonas luteoviolacea 2ta16]KZN35471.1 hypothetical protein N483_00535 [Pseudoalteromonas luteoviolacea NCIMB 1944]MCG7546558.1 hypothetical protein [Pseudoalteromonas sp. Of7M-16]MDK2595810.1 hypothetical protein [Pseudoalteromonas sp. P94(2023)]
MKKCAAALASTLMLTGCFSTPEADTGSVRLDSPEVHSQPMKVKMAIGLDKGQPIPISDSPLGSNDTGVYASLEMSLGGGFAAKVQTGKALKTTLKYQFSGQHAESAQAGNVSHAITLAYLTDEESGTDFETGEYINEDSKRDWKLDHDLIDIAWITGYRLSPEALLYGSIFYQTGEIDGTYYRSTFGGCAERHAPECAQSTFSDDGSAYGLSVSFEYAFTKSFLGSLELVHSRSNWFNRNEDDTLVNGNLIYQF